MNPLVLFAVYFLFVRSLFTATTSVLTAETSLRGAAMARQVDPDLKRSVNALLEAANYLAYVQNREQDVEYANHLYEQINWIRDLAEILLPTENDFGTNVVPFVPRQRA